ncbi:MAG: hypothetical protein ACREUQ_10120 [Burkholderiales bacterium]
MTSPWSRAPALQQREPFPQYVPLAQGLERLIARTRHLPELPLLGLHFVERIPDLSQRLVLNTEHISMLLQQVPSPCH